MTNVNLVDWLILCCTRRISHGFCSRPKAESTGYISILPREYLSTPRQPERISYIDPCHSSSTTSLLSSDVSSLGQLTLVPQFGDQSDICPTGDDVTAMGTSIPHNHTTSTI
jgi:hypothetical protein